MLHAPHTKGHVTRVSYKMSCYTRLIQKVTRVKQHVWLEHDMTFKVTGDIGVI